MNAVADAVRRKSVVNRLKGALVRKRPEKPPELKVVLKNLAEGSSLHGVPKIVSSPQIAVKILWSLLFLATFGFLCFQIYTLFSTYSSLPVDTSVSLKFSPLRFPAITICNMNPVMVSKMDVKELLRKPAKREKRNVDYVNAMKMAMTKQSTKEKAIRESTEQKLDLEIAPTPVQRETLEHDYVGLQPSDSINTADFIKHLEELESRLIHRAPRAASSSSSFPNSPATASSSPATSPNLPPTSPGSSSTSSSGGISALLSSLQSSSPSSGSSSSSSSSYNGGCWWCPYSYSSSSYSYSSSSAYDDQGSDGGAGHDFGGYFTGQRDGWVMQQRRFQYNFKSMPVDNRTSVGHDIDDIVLSMTFLGILRNTSAFTRLATAEYGNCYTLDEDLFTAWRSGPANGLSLTMNLQRDEYVSNFASGYGVRIVFHEPGTFPLPSSEGITLSPGTDNNVALKTVRLTRLGEPYGKCNDGKEFKQSNGYTYSSSACLQICRTNVVIQRCGCLPFDAPELPAYWNTDLKVCQVTDPTVEMCILEKADGALGQGEIKCDCPLPCSEIVYEKTLSWRQWPNTDYMKNVLIEKMCKKNLTSANYITNQGEIKEECNTTGTNITCNATKLDICHENATLDVFEWQKNFLRVQIYFEDLNFENIVEKPSYEFVRFISDIGGAMGLFMGASILSLVEFLQLTLEVILWCYDRFTRRKKIHKTVNIAPIDTIPGKPKLF